MRFKMLFILALPFLLFSCATIDTKPVFNRQQHEPAEFKKGDYPKVTFYKKRSPWQSPFNPHEVLQYWEKIWAGRPGPGSLVVVMGNPKINWKNIDPRRNNPGQMTPPEGEFSAAVIFIFKAVPDRPAELAIYGFMLRGGKFMYRWNTEKQIYEKLSN